MNKTQIGDITEQKFILYCLENDIPISRPIGNNLPYDFIIEIDNQLLKIQVKTSRRSRKTKDVITFNTRSTSKNYNEVVNTDYIGKIDYFTTFWEGKWFFIRVDDAPIGQYNIYLGEEPKPNQNSYKKLVLF